MSESHFWLEARLASIADAELVGALLRAQVAYDAEQHGERFAGFEGLPTIGDVVLAEPQRLRLYQQVGAAGTEAVKGLLRALQPVTTVLHAYYESLDDDYKALWGLVDGIPAELLAADALSERALATLLADDGFETLQRWVGRWQKQRPATSAVAKKPVKSAKPPPPVLAVSPGSFRPEDKAWVKQRKALFARFKSGFNLRLADSSKALQRWLLDGGETRHLHFSWELLVLHPDDDREMLQRFVAHRLAAGDSRFQAATAAPWAWSFIRECAQHDLEPRRQFEGREQRIADLCFPPIYTAEVIDQGDRKQRLFPLPAEEFFSFFTNRNLCLLCDEACNPHTLSQYLIPQFLSLLSAPEYADRDWTGGAENEPGVKLRKLFRRTQDFVEPRGPADEPSTAQQFADNFHAAVEQTALPASVRKAWNHVQTPRGRYEPVPEGDGDWLELRTLHGVQANEAAVAGLVDLFREQGWSNAGFEPAGWEAIDIGPEISVGFARLLGYPAGGKKARERDPADVNVPARRYTIRTTTAFSACDQADGDIRLQLILPDRAPGFAPSEHTPWLLAYADYGAFYDRFYPRHEAVLRWRQALRMTESRHGVAWVAHSGHYPPDGNYEVVRNRLGQLMFATPQWPPIAPLWPGDEDGLRASRYG